MIPKIIHWGLFGGWKLSELDRVCMTSWSGVLKDYENKAWTDENGPQDRFFREALKLKPVNASNYIKFWALYNFGGVFMDNDVQVLHPFDLNHGAFMAFQRDDTEKDCVNGAVIGAEPQHPLIKSCLDEFANWPGDVCPIECGVSLLTRKLYERGMTGLNVEQQVGDVMVYSKERFYPWRWNEPKDFTRITPRTFAVHHWEGSWIK